MMIEKTLFYFIYKILFSLINFDHSTEKNLDRTSDRNGKTKTFDVSITSSVSTPNMCRFFGQVVHAITKPTKIVTDVL